MFSFRVGFVNMKLKIFFIFLFLNNMIQATIFSDFFIKKAYENNDFKEVTRLLEKEQIMNPYNSIINYNLGSAYYHLGNFKNAKHNLQRSVENCNEKQTELKEKAYFNWGNSFYKSCLMQLGKGWQNNKIDDNVLDLAIAEIKSSIEKYKNTLVLNENNNKALVNKKNAEEILKKLEEKKKESNKEDNKDQKNNDQHDSKDKKNNQENKDDNKQKEQDKESSKDDKKLDFNQDQNLSQEKQKDDQSQNSEQENKGQNSSQDTQKNGEERKDEKLDSEQTKQEKNNVNNREQDSSFEQNDKQNSEQASSKNDKEQGQKNQETRLEEQKTEEILQESKDGLQQDDIKTKMLRVVLDDLQKDEARLQKMLIKHKTKGVSTNLDKGQKPW